MSGCKSVCVCVHAHVHVWIQSLKGGKNYLFLIYTLYIFHWLCFPKSLKHEKELWEHAELKDRFTFSPVHLKRMKQVLFFAIIPPVNTVQLNDPFLMCFQWKWQRTKINSPRSVLNVYKSLCDFGRTFFFCLRLKMLNCSFSHITFMLVFFSFLYVTFHYKDGLGWKKAKKVCPHPNYMHTYMHTHTHTHLSLLTVGLPVVVAPARTQT